MSIITCRDGITKRSNDVNILRSELVDSSGGGGGGIGLVIGGWAGEGGAAWLSLVISYVGTGSCIAEHIFPCEVCTNRVVTQRNM